MIRILTVLATLGLLAGVAWGVGAYWTAGTPVESAAARRDTIREYVDEQAITRLPETYSITMPFGGRVERVDLRVGEPVSEGQIVARVVSEDIDNELAEAQAVVDRLRAALAERRDISLETTAKEQARQLAVATGHNVEALKAQLQAARRQLEYAEGFLADVRRLAADGIETADAVQRADVDFVRSRAEVTQTTRNLEAAQATLIAVSLAPNLIQDYINRRDLEAQAVREQVVEAEARLKQVQLRAQRGPMTSPITGVVLERPIYSEQFLAPGTLLMTIGRLDDLEVEADLLSQEVIGIRPRQPVEIYGAAVGSDVGEGLAGYLHRIYPRAFTKISSLGVEQQRVKTIVQFAPESRERVRELRLGVDYRVRVRIVTAEQQDALVVPRSSLFRREPEGWQVFAIREGRAVHQAVDVGLMNDELAEITRGLSEGERVVVAPESQLRPGTRVQPAAAGR